MTGGSGQSPSTARLLLLGLGNEFMADDAVGLHVVRAIQNRLPAGGPVTVRESPQMGFALLDELTGFAAALLIDAIHTGLASPGHVHVLDAAALRALPVTSPHFAGVGEMMALGRRLDLSLPAEVRVLAIETADPFTFATEMTPLMRQAFAQVVETVWSEVQRVKDSLSLGGAQG